MSIADQTIVLTTLNSLDETIDQFFDFLREKNQEHLLDIHCPYFGILWPSSQALTKVLQSEIAQGKIKSKNQILELGCGLALPSLWFLKKGEHLTISDSHPDVPAFLEKNLSNNLIPFENASIINIDWILPIEAHLKNKFDLIYASDVLYEEKLPRALAKKVLELLTPLGCFYLADPGRPYLQLFVDEMTKLGFKNELFSEGSIFLFRFDRSK